MSTKYRSCTSALCCFLIFIPGVVLIGVGAKLYTDWRGSDRQHAGTAILSVGCVAAFAGLVLLWADFKLRCIKIRWDAKDSRRIDVFDDRSVTTATSSSHSAITSHDGSSGASSVASVHDALELQRQRDAMWLAHVAPGASTGLHGSTTLYPASAQQLSALPPPPTYEEAIRQAVNNSLQQPTDAADDTGVAVAATGDGGETESHRDASGDDTAEHSLRREMTAVNPDEPSVTT